MKHMAKDEPQDDDVLTLLKQRKQLEKKIADMPPEKKQATIDSLLSRIASLEADLELLGHNRQPVHATAPDKPKQKRAPKKCSLCGIEGHTARTCPSKTETAKA